MTNGLQQITITNYQSIKNAKLDLGNITIISGRSDSGKSAFFRAVKGAIINQSGEDYITAGEKETSVQIDNVKWLQSKKENVYEVGKRRWEKCGRGVPDEVRNELDMGEFEFGKDIRLLLNFSGQLDKAFIVQGNPADNAKVIGSISNVHIVYNAIREAEKDTKNIKRQMNISQEQLEETQASLDTDEKELKKISKYHDILEEIFISAKRIDTSNSKLVSLKTRYMTLKTDTCALEVKLQCYKGVNLDKIQEKIDQVSGLMQTKVQYEKLIVKKNGIIEDIKSTQAVNKALKGVSIERGLISLNAIETLLKLKADIKKLDEQIDYETHAVCMNSSEVSAFQEEIDKIDACDECGSLKEHWTLGV